MHKQLSSSFLVDDVVHCAQMVDVDLERHVWRVKEGGGASVGALGIPAQEIDCWFDEEITFSWSEPSTQLTMAPCHVSDRVQPTLYAIEMFPELPSPFQLWEQDVDEPMTYHVCDMPG